jgi:hypothetical protein
VPDVVVALPSNTRPANSPSHSPPLVTIAPPGVGIVMFTSVIASAHAEQIQIELTMMAVIDLAVNFIVLTVIALRQDLQN